MNRIAFVLLLLVAGTAIAADVPATQPATPAAVIGLRGEINDYSRDAFFRRVQFARDAGAKTIIVEIDSYGGLVTSSLDISQFIKNLSDLDTVAFINPKAISGAAMVAMACKHIVMVHDGVFGDCAPIAINSAGELTTLGPTERAKFQSPILADFYDSAMRNGRNPLLAEAMIALDRNVYWLASPTGERRLVNEQDQTKLLGEGWKPVDSSLNPVNNNTLLTVHTPLALQLGLADAETDSIDALAAARHLNIVARLEPGPGEDMVYWLNSSAARLVLLIIFGVALYMSLHTHGHGLSTLVAIAALGLLVAAPLMTGYAQWWEIAMILVGLALLMLEVFVIPGAGLKAVAGVVMVVIGLVLSFAGKEPVGPGLLPQLPETWQSIERGLLVVIVGLSASGVISLWFSQYLPKIPYFRRFVLTATSGSSAGFVAARQPKSEGGSQTPWPPLGTVGRAVTDLRPGGRAEFRDDAAGTTRVMSVVCESGYVTAGSAVEVLEVGLNRVLVKSAAAT